MTDEKRPYRPCIFRKSNKGIFQCEKHFYAHYLPEAYDELYKICTETVPEYFCPHIDFGFNLQSENKIFINCTHTYKARCVKNFKECEPCDFPDKDGASLG